jgi:glycosyltransferase involved in cell wall biosynthesis
MDRKILFLVPYPLRESPSQRFRFEQYFALLVQQGYDYSVQSFLNSNNWQIFFSRGNTLGKTTAIATGFIKRTIALFKSPMYDFVFIHREASPIGPPILEFILAKVLRKKIVYDFDDAIWLTDRDSESWLMRIAKSRSKVAHICKWAYKVSCGNEYLCSYAARFNKNVIYNPTTIDVENLHNPALHPVPDRLDNQIRIGWTGSHSTLKYLMEVEEVLQKVLEADPYLRFVVIADKQPSFKVISCQFIPWNVETEITELRQFDVGIMPLPDDAWAKGKCGFKALQYMSLEIPVVASPVGVNSKIIQRGISGFLCSTPKEWELALEKLVRDSHLRKKMGVNGRKMVVENYSVISNSDNFLSLFN